MAIHGFTNFNLHRALGSGESVAIRIIAVVEDDGSFAESTFTTTVTFLMETISIQGTRIDAGSTFTLTLVNSNIRLASAREDSAPRVVFI